MEAIELTDSGSTTLAVTSLQCLSYRFEWADKLDEDFGRANLHPDFEKDLNHMRNAADALGLIVCAWRGQPVVVFGHTIRPTDALMLVQKYGTHFYKWAEMGGKIEQLTAVSDSLLASHSEKSISTAISSSFSASLSGGFGAFSGGGSASGAFDDEGQVETVQDSDMENHYESSQVKSYGGIPFNTLEPSWDEWATSIDSLPVAINYQLEEILNILPDEYNKYGVNIRDMWNEAVGNYFPQEQPIWHNQYTIFIQLHGSDAWALPSEVYGPFAYRFVGPSWAPQIMDDPAVLKVPGSAFPQMYFKYAHPIPADHRSKLQFSAPIEAIELYSSNNFMSLLDQPPISEAEHQHFSLLDFIAQLNYVSIFDYAVGKEYLYQPESDLYQNIFETNNHWTEDFGTLYRVSRDFYQVFITFVGNATGSFADYNGLLQIKIYGSKGLVTQFLPVDTNATYYSPELYVQVDSQTDIGSISGVDIEVVYGKTEDRTCVNIGKIKVVDLEDNVYTSNLPEQINFCFFTIPFQVIPILGFVYVNNPAGTRGSTTITVYPWANNPTANSLYGYQILKNGSAVMTWNEGMDNCAKLGGALASEYYLTKLRDAGVDWCTPNPSWWLESYFETAPECVFLHARDTQCGRPGRTDVVTHTGCAAVCVGPLPSEIELASTGCILYGDPVPIALSYASLENTTWIGNSSYNISGGHSPPPPSSPPVSIPPPPLADVDPSMVALFTAPTSGLTYGTTNNNKCMLEQSFAAMNKVAVGVGSGIYNSAEACGTCVKITTLSDTFIGFVNDICYSCSANQLSLAGDPISALWQFIPCSVGYEKMQYYFDASTNNFYVKMRVLNYRVPVRLVLVYATNWKGTGQWVPLVRSDDNFFTAGFSGDYTIQFPLLVDVQSVYGDSVQEYVAYSTQVVQGSAQF